jgi:5-hydroxyisourate hydrolase-like protein (transthyretin family)
MPSDDGTTAGVRPRISTHILDTATGQPARDVHVRLERRDADGWPAATGSSSPWSRTWAGTRSSPR